MQTLQTVVAALFFIVALAANLPLRAQSTASTTTATDDALRKLLAAIASQPLTSTAFTERRTSALFTKPLESRGNLSYKPGGVIEKQTTHPIRETLTITAESLTIDAGSGAPPQVLRLDAQAGQLATLVLGLRAVLGGDDRQLLQLFDTRYSGSADGWQVTLTPKGPAVRRGVRQIVVRGTGSQLRQIETTEVNGDVTDMVLAAR